MMLLRTIDESVLNRFVSGHPNVHYMKTGMWAHFKEKTDGDAPSFLGFYEDEELKATAMVLSNTWLMHKYLYVPWGPCMDYEDEHVRNEVFRLLKEYADEKNVQFLRVDPNVVRCHHTITGELIEDGYSNECVTEDLKRLGYTHKGYGYAYNGSWTNRYTLFVDLSADMDTVISRFAKPRRTSLNRHKTTHVTTRIGTKDDLPYLMDFERQLAEQDGFAPHSRQFFEALLDCFGEHAVLYVTEIDLDAMIQGISDELAGKKYRKDPEAREAKEKELEKASQLKETWGAKLPIACGLFIRLGHMSWDLYTYNHKAFGFVKPVDSLHAFAMNDMKQNGVTVYDMCGFSGTASREDPYYGLYSYKRSFGPEFIEQIGEFDYVRREKAMKRFRFEKLAVNHLKRKWWRMRYMKTNKS
ncbi:MAG: aminoacyltransferase [Erysipelotrichaceae bacterium]|nr:aminoacyltransferase [Erysipelotrichaceae bacterium]